MKIFNISAAKKDKKFKIFNVVSYYIGSWTEEPYFQIYTLTKNVKITVGKFKIVGFKSKISEKDHEFITSHSWDKLGKSK